MLRKKYVPAYIKCLHDNKLGGDAGIEAMDAELQEATILVFRRLAHAKVSSCNDMIPCFHFLLQAVGCSVSMLVSWTSVASLKVCRLHSVIDGKN